MRQCPRTNANNFVAAASIGLRLVRQESHSRRAGLPLASRPTLRWAHTPPRDGRPASPRRDRAAEHFAIQFGSLDKERRREMSDELQSLTHVLGRIILVWHQEELASAFPHRYTLALENAAPRAILTERDEI